MTSGSAKKTESDRTPPVVVVGLGNILLADDGVGPRLLDIVRQYEHGHNGSVEYIDGGTQGLALLGRLTNRRAIIFLDAISAGSEPGTIHTWTAKRILQKEFSGSTTAHESSAAELLRALLLTDGLPETVIAIGVEPAETSTSVGLSRVVERALSEAAYCADTIIQSIAFECEAEGGYKKT